MTGFHHWSELEYGMGGQKRMQLAGHLRGRAMQEWNLLRPEEKADFTEAVEHLVDPGGHRKKQSRSPTLSGVWNGLAYGREVMSAETGMLCCMASFRQAYVMTS